MKDKITEQRKEVERIIRINLPLININNKMCQEVADCIIAYFYGLEAKK